MDPRYFLRFNLFLLWRPCLKTCRLLEADTAAPTNSLTLGSSDISLRFVEILQIFKSLAQLCRLLPQVRSHELLWLLTLGNSSVRHHWLALLFVLETEPLLDLVQDDSVSDQIAGLVREQSLHAKLFGLVTTSLIIISKSWKRCYRAKVGGWSHR